MIPVTATKRFITLGAVALMASASPVWSQGDTNLNQPVAPQQSTGTRVNAPAVSPEVQLEQDRQEARERQMQRDQMQRDVATTGSVVDEPAGAATPTRNWSWLGLLGLLGLFGLRRRHDVEEGTYRPVRP